MPSPQASEVAVLEVPPLGIPGQCQARVSEKKWAEAKGFPTACMGGPRFSLDKSKNHKYRSRRLHPASTNSRRGHCLTGVYLAWTTRRPDASCWCQYKIQTREHLFKNCPQWKSQQKALWTTVLEETRKLPGPTRGRDRTKIAELFADERCGQAILATTDVGRMAGPPVAEDARAAASEASEWDSRGTARSFEGGGRAAPGEGGVE